MMFKYPLCICQMLKQYQLLYFTQMLFWRGVALIVHEETCVVILHCRIFLIVYDCNNVKTEPINSFNLEEMNNMETLYNKVLFVNALAMKQYIFYSNC